MFDVTAYRAALPSTLGIRGDNRSQCNPDDRFSPRAVLGSVRLWACSTRGRHSIALAIATVLGVVAPTLSAAQAVARQTPSERRLAAQCYQRSDAHLNNPFSYPLRVGASTDSKSLQVFVAPEKWRAMTETVRVARMRDIACWYAGGRMQRSFWYDFSAVDPDTDRTVETIPASKLWPGSKRR
jgi:hypothetical protein